MEVVVDAMGEGSEGAAVLQTSSPDTPSSKGKTPFDAIAYGRIGGQNVSPSSKMRLSNACPNWAWT